MASVYLMFSTLYYRILGNHLHHLQDLLSIGYVTSFPQICRARSAYMTYNWLFLTEMFDIPKVIKWKSGKTASITHVFWKLRGTFLRTKSVEVGFSELL